ncbi:peptide ABC transporter substrate-binding protein [Acetivibrio straminisolvens]|uniref:Oligopeptide ABC transporter n=1 Tax=Acetivibrio straminisolvens JCM 21531 TaxID=1294263 RepID=W4V8C5_9FIRM|nr:peptide ABC transporter substrate-binding protein [Acetivibrio straminisolvens]GAE89457.1 oligopeptide ABC transporter [Acetivibrio straminisolvens JCM 21531]
MGNGPFKIEEWNHDDSIVLTKNETYWNSENIKLDRINFRMISDNTAAINSFKAGEIDMVAITDPLLIEEFKKDGYQVESYDAGVVRYISINNDDPILRNVNIRKALAYAIDRNTFVEKVLRDGSQKALGFVSPVVRGYEGYFREKAGDLFKDNDVKKAKELLAQGLKELNLSNMPKLSILVDGKEISKRDAQVIQDMWRKNLGVEAEIQIMSFDAMTEKMMQGDYRMALLMWAGDYNDPRAYLEVFSSANFYNVAYYVNLYFDELLAKSIEEKDPQKRMNLLVEAEKTAMNEMPVCPVYFAQKSYAVRPGVKGLVRGSSSIQDIDLYWTYIE